MGDDIGVVDETEFGGPVDGEVELVGAEARGFRLRHFGRVYPCDVDCVDLVLAVDGDDPPRLVNVEVLAAVGGSPGSGTPQSNWAGWRVRSDWWRAMS